MIILGYHQSVKVIPDVIPDKPICQRMFRSTSAQGFDFPKPVLPELVRIHYLTDGGQWMEYSLYAVDAFVFVGTLEVYALIGF